jgi:hypothetical protein
MIIYHGSFSLFVRFFFVPGRRIAVLSNDVTMEAKQDDTFFCDFRREEEKIRLVVDESTSRHEHSVAHFGGISHAWHLTAMGEDLHRSRSEKEKARQSIILSQRLFTNETLHGSAEFGCNARSVTTTDSAGNMFAFVGAIIHKRERMQNDHSVATVSSLSSTTRHVCRYTCRGARALAVSFVSAV